MVKAGPKKRRAKEEKLIREAVEQNTVKIAKPLRKAGKVRMYAYKEPGDPTPRNLTISEDELWYIMRMPKGLSLEAQWMEHRVEGWCPLEWYELFDPDKEVWDVIIEIARDFNGA